MKKKGKYAMIKLTVRKLSTYRFFVDLQVRRCFMYDRVR